MKRSNILIIFAHPNKKSFNKSLVDVACDVLKDKGNHVDVIDLYRDGFKVFSGPEDFKTCLDADNFKYKNEQFNALENDLFVDNIKYSQDKLKSADFVIFQFPLWWFGMPSIMKAWVERVFSYGYAYNGRKNIWFSNGVFKGKKIMLSITTSGPEHIYKSNGINGDIDQILWPIHNGIFNFTGFTVLKPYISWGVDIVDAVQRLEYLQNYKEILEDYDDIENVCFEPLENYNKNYMLKDKKTNVINL